VTNIFNSIYQIEIFYLTHQQNVLCNHPCMGMYNIVAG